MVVIVIGDVDVIFAEILLSLLVVAFTLNLDKTVFVLFGGLADLLLSQLMDAMD